MNNIHVLNLSSYTTPVIQESKRENWVEFGIDNNYYNFLISNLIKTTKIENIITRNAINPDKVLYTIFFNQIDI